MTTEDDNLPGAPRKEGADDLPGTPLSAAEETRAVRTVRTDARETEPTDGQRRPDESARAEDALALRETSDSLSESDRSPRERDLDAVREEREEREEDEEDAAGTPAVLGAQRFVFAAYFAAGIAVAFLLSKAFSYSWARLALWKPQVGEPNDEISMPVAAVIGALVAFYYYRDEKTRTLAEEVASELGKVSWPTRDEVVNGTFVVVVTTFIATAFFALMDRFWGFVTNLVYGA